jgi:hypothetical protein
MNQTNVSFSFLYSAIINSHQIMEQSVVSSARWQHCIKTTPKLKY